MPPIRKRPTENAPTGNGFKHLFDLVNAANKYDRFLLLNDPSVPESDLDNAIHPIFRGSNFDYGKENEHAEFIYDNMETALRLASQFLRSESVLEFLVAPLLGRTLLTTKKAGETQKTYLSNPLANKSEAQRKDLIDEVRKALYCLSNCITFIFVEDEINSYARTLMDKELPPHDHTSACTRHFASEHSTKIEIRPQYRKLFLEDYQEGSRCKQFRICFNFATVIIHEVIHAVGVMRRGNMTEPYLRPDHPKAELGFAWENFMFGAILNPFDHDLASISYVMRKIWSCCPTAKAAGGKEWATVPVSYIAQWFRKKTWAIIAERGPAAIPPPHTELKIISTTGCSFYAVYSDSEEKLAPLRVHKAKAAKIYPQKYAESTYTVSDLHATFVNIHVVPTDELQKMSLKAPSRAPPPLPSYGPTQPAAGLFTVAARPNAASARLASFITEDKSTSAPVSLSQPCICYLPDKCHVPDAPCAAVPASIRNPLKRRSASTGTSGRRSKAARI